MKHYDKNTIHKKAQELLEAHKQHTSQEEIALDVLAYIEEIYKGLDTEDEKTKLSALLIDTVAEQRQSFAVFNNSPGPLVSTVHAKEEGMPKFFSFADYMRYAYKATNPLNLDESKFSKGKSIIAKSTTLLSHRLWSNYSEFFSPVNAAKSAMYDFAFTISTWVNSVAMLSYSGINEPMLKFSGVLLGVGAVVPPVVAVLTSPFLPILPIYYHQPIPAISSRVLFACSSAISLAAVFTSGQSLTHKHALLLLPTIINLALSAIEYIDHYKQADEIKGLIKGIEEERKEEPSLK